MIKLILPTLENRVIEVTFSMKIKQLKINIKEDLGIKDKLELNFMSLITLVKT